MVPPGLVRRITRPDEVAERTWEISHDFVARLLDPILYRPRVTPWQRLRPWLTSAALVLWLLAIVVALPLERNRQALAARDEAMGELGVANCTVRVDFDDQKRRIYRINCSSLGSLSTIRPALQELDRSGFLWLDFREDSPGVVHRPSPLDLKPLAGLTGLQTLDISGRVISDLKPLAGMTALHTLDLRAGVVSDLTPLAGLTALQTLRLSYFRKISDLKPLAGLIGLQTLDISECTGVSDLKPLAGLTTLQLLNLSECTGVSDLKPLAGLTRLRVLNLFRCTMSRT